jgi:hypothetical protein
MVASKSVGHTRGLCLRPRIKRDFDPADDLSPSGIESGRRSCTDREGKLPHRLRGLVGGSAVWDTSGVPRVLNNEAVRDPDQGHSATILASSVSLPPRCTEDGALEERSPPASTNQPDLSVIDGSFVFFVVLVITAADPIILGSLGLIFVGADGLARHVARVVMELSRLPFRRVAFGLDPCCCSRNAP